MNALRGSIARSAATTPLAGPGTEPPRISAPPPAWARPARTRTGRPRWLIPALALAAIVLVVVVLVSALGGGDGKSSSSRQASSGSAAKHRPSSPKSSSPAPSTTSQAQGIPSADPGVTLKSFYDNSVGGSIDDSWPLATDNLHTQVGGYDNFKAGESDVSSFDWNQVTTTSKTAGSPTGQGKGGQAAHGTR